MPAHLIATHFRNLSASLLDAILSHVRCSKHDQLCYSGCRVGLADGNEFYLVRRTAASAASRSQLGADVLKSCCKLIFGRFEIRHTDFRNQFDTES
jgi:hypothetical protein